MKKRWGRCLVILVTAVVMVSIGVFVVKYREQKTARHSQADREKGISEADIMEERKSGF